MNLKSVNLLFIRQIIFKSIKHRRNGQLLTRINQHVLVTQITGALKRLSSLLRWQHDSLNRLVTQCALLAISIVQWSSANRRPTTNNYSDLAHVVVVFFFAKINFNLNQLSVLFCLFTPDAESVAFTLNRQTSANVLFAFSRQDLPKNTQIDRSTLCVHFARLRSSFHRSASLFASITRSSFTFLFSFVFVSVIFGFLSQTSQLQSQSQ